MMDDDLTLIFSMRKVLGSAAAGGGLAGSLVREFATSAKGREVARRVLLGLPLQVSLAPLTSSRSSEVSMLATLIVGATEGSVPEAATKGEELSRLMERWVKARENVNMESRVLRFRSLIACGVLGAVCAMISTVGPFIESVSLGSQTPSTNPAGLAVTAAAMTASSSAMLGLYSAGKGVVLNVAVSLAAFALVYVLAAPLATFSLSFIG